MLDTTFDGDGKVTTDFDSYEEIAYSVSVQADGKIVAAGYSYSDSTGYDFALARYNSDGLLDTAFDSDGKVTTDFGIEDIAYSVAVQADGNDQILFSPGANSGEVAVKLNGVSLGTFQPIGHIIAYGQAGDDDLQVTGSIAISAWLYGQSGHDRLKGGSGHDLLLGGIGDDLLVGGSGRDVMIGGMGADRLVGNADDDILIAGATLYDANDEALCAIMAEWTSSRTYEQRIANLNGIGSGADFDNRLNGNVFLKTGPTAAQSTLFDDLAEDVLTGSSGLDWFLFNGNQDRATDLKDEVYTDDLEFILS